MIRKRVLMTACMATAYIAHAEVATAADEPAQESEVVVTGTRDATTTEMTSTAPLDVVTASSLALTGVVDLARGLETTEPEINIPRAVGQPTAASTRAFTLNGLYPDELLMLVDGKRYHASSVLNTNAGVGRGSAPYDLNTIPLQAIDHIEVLRDGGSAQYGSDAIAGVVNIILKSNASGGTAVGQAGVTGRGDGANGDVAINDGFKIGERGFLSVTAEANVQAYTDRADTDQRYGRDTFRLGDPESRNLNLALNGGFGALPFGELYADLLASYRTSTDTPLYEPPGYSPLYPLGFRPDDTADLWDVQGTVGVRGPVADGFKYDLSNTYGRSGAAFYSDKSANAALGAASPTSFSAGGPIYDQDVTDLSFTRPLPEILAGGNLAAGGQIRYEHYQIVDGDAASIASAGAATLPGFSPRIPVDNGRTAEAAFLDLELKPAHWLTLGAAGRYDRYSDFGGAFTYKVSGRAEATSWLAFRGELGTGFRAPSMQQEFYNTVSTTATGVNKALVNVGTFQVADPVSEALGATPLKAETSHNYSAAAVLTPIDRLSITAGLFRIDVDNRIVLSDSQSGTVVNAALATAGITNVQQVAFFTNGINTRTTGANITAAYSGDIGSNTHYRASIAYDHNWTKITRLATDTAAPSLQLLTAHSKLLLTDAQPADKLVADFSLSRGPFSASLDVTRYGSYTDIPIAPVQTFNANTLVDLSASYEFAPGAKATVGVLNLGNVYPDKLTDIQAAYGTYGNALVYGVESPDGTDGRSFYLRMTKRF
jgi:iron complex outermembrane receptor protein